MRTLLKEAFQKASMLSDAEQDLLATRLLMEFDAVNAFDQAIEQTALRLTKLVNEALAEDDAGLTEPLDPDTLDRP
jgi:hypothetical protein